jgi:hypothetical protein
MVSRQRFVQPVQMDEMAPRPSLPFHALAQGGAIPNDFGKLLVQRELLGDDRGDSPASARADDRALGATAVRGGEDGVAPIGENKERKRKT